MDSIENSLILTMLRDQNTVLSEQGKSLARVEESVRTSQHRLFGNGQPGLIQNLVERNEHLYTEVSDLKAGIQDVRTSSKAEIAEIRSESLIKKAYAIGWASCAGTFLTFALAWIGKKFGIHF